MSGHLVLITSEKMFLQRNYIKVVESFELQKVKNNDCNQDMIIIAYTFDSWEWVFLSLFLIKIKIWWFISVKLVSEQDNLILFL